MLKQVRLKFNLYQLDRILRHANKYIQNNFEKDDLLTTKALRLNSCDNILSYRHEPSAQFNLSNYYCFREIRISKGMYILLDLVSKLKLEKLMKRKPKLTRKEKENAKKEQVKMWLFALNCSFIMMMNNNPKFQHPVYKAQSKENQFKYR